MFNALILPFLETEEKAPKKEAPLESRGTRAAAVSGKSHRRFQKPRWPSGRGRPGCRTGGESASCGPPA